MRGVRPSDQVGHQLGGRRRELQAGALVPGGDDQVAIAGGRPDVGPGVDAAGAKAGPGRLDLGPAQRRAEPDRLVQQVAHGRARWSGCRSRRPPRSPRPGPGRPARDEVVLAVLDDPADRVTLAFCRSRTIWPFNGGVGAARRARRAAGPTRRRPPRSPGRTRIDRRRSGPRRSGLPASRTARPPATAEPRPAPRPAAAQRPEGARDCEPGPGREGSRRRGSPGSGPARPGGDRPAASRSWTMPSTRHRPAVVRSASSSASVQATSTPPVRRKPLSMPVSSRSAADHSGNSSALHERSWTAGAVVRTGLRGRRDQPGAGPRRLAAQLAAIEHRAGDPLARQGIGDRQPDHATAHDHHIVILGIGSRSRCHSAIRRGRRSRRTEPAARHRAGRFQVAAAIRSTPAPR